MSDRTGVAALVVAGAGFWAVGVLVDVTAGLVVLVAGVVCGVGLLVRAHEDERRRRLCRGAGTGVLLLPLVPGTGAAVRRARGVKPTPGSYPAHRHGGAR